MISANIDNKTRRAVYNRDGYRCALCDTTKYLQIHHYCKRSLGGNDTEHNLTAKRATTAVRVTDIR